MSRPRTLMHTVIAANTTTDANFRAMPRTGTWRAVAGLFTRTRIMPERTRRAVSSGRSTSEVGHAHRRSRFRVDGQQARDAVRAGGPRSHVQLFAQREEA